jgi:hypothetical protein
MTKERRVQRAGWMNDEVMDLGNFAAGINIHTNECHLSDWGHRSFDGLCPMISMPLD